MTGDFRLIDYIFDLFLGQTLSYALRTFGVHNELHGIIFMTF